MNINVPGAHGAMPKHFLVKYLRKRRHSSILAGMEQKMLSNIGAAPRGRKGGLARKAALSSEERSLIARQAAQQRWKSQVLRASHGSPDHPLKIGDLEIGCYVLENGTRVLSQSSMVGALGKRRQGGGGGDNLATFVQGSRISPFVPPELSAMIAEPLRFRPPHGGTPAFGYPAAILPEICEAILAAREAGKLQPQQLHIADRCEILVRGFARVGIIALIDEATGYEKERAANSLAQILEAFIAKELQPWIRTFPVDYYSELFRLRGLTFPDGKVQRPWYFGHLTNDIVYRRLAPGVLAELKRVKAEVGKPGDKLFQRLTTNLGYPKLREHLGAVVAIMQLSHDYDDFKDKLDRLRPAYGEMIPLPFPIDELTESGRGF
ncbi:MAG: P63C domain-containing protein [Candidatus Tyrphobacter sp.]